MIQLFVLLYIIFIFATYFFLDGAGNNIGMYKRLLMSTFWPVTLTGLALIVLVLRVRKY